MDKLYTTRRVEGRTIYKMNGVEYHDASLFFHVLIRTMEARAIQIPSRLYKSFEKAFQERALRLRYEADLRADLNGM